jgi:nucleoid DNA-binding protein
MKREIPLATCGACGSTWFRASDFYAFKPEQFLGPFWKGWPLLVGQDSMAPMTILICLCGTPLDPSIGGLQGGHTPLRELSEFLESLGRAKEQLRQLRDGSAVIRLAEEQFIQNPALQEVERRLKTLQLEIGRRMRGGQGRHPEPPTRSSSAKEGTLTKDDLVLELQNKGYSFSESRKLVKLILKIMKASLRRGEEVMVPPLGTFTVKMNPPTQVRVRQGWIQTMNRYPRSVKFKPTADLVALVNMARSRGKQVQQKATSAEKANPMHPTNKRLSCDKCGSTSFTDVFFRQWHNFPSSMPGGGLSPVANQDAMPVLICMCGNLIPPGHLRQQVPGHLRSLRESFNAAMGYRARCHPQYTVNQLNSEFADKQQHAALLERIAVLEKIVQDLPKPVATVKKKKKNTEEIRQPHRTD